MRRLLLILVVLPLSAKASASPPEEAPPTPQVRITAPRGGQTEKRVVDIKGTVEGVVAKRLTLVLNGVPLSIPLNEGAFSTTQVLAPGPNAIRALVQKDGETIADDVALYAMVPSKDLRITLTWDTPDTDVDLWVTGPDGEKISYQKKQGQAGGTLDTDVTTGYGPETYTQARAQLGTYRVQAHYYGGALPTQVTLDVIRGEGSAREERRTFRTFLLKTSDVVEVGEFVIAR